ncbi:hypothetical protein ID858_10315 [Xenorhabdus sp. DI]|uniref:hypothetical protein n=1 Tax=Xenorhabdus doucetiae TaxID=351671 RepID=UPI0019C1E9E4|nr:MULTISPECIES: hypothetical protein [unclassified Xenorhabdus]MBD2786341.1 hypothetical protein [Xenorhabdus sp. 3]MBD2788904.1 hypothetical protein [Xenorhabdus sp. DI]
MKQVQAMVTLILIDGVTYQIALPKHIIALQVKQALAIAQEFGGKLVECDFANIKPMEEVIGLPLSIRDKGDAENEN